MGAWGAGPFQNDGAADWLADFEDDPIGAVETTFSEFDACEQEYVDSDVGCMVIAAAEAIATAHGAPNRALPSEIADTMAAHVSAVREIDGAAEKILAALDRILGDDSELAELWSEDGVEPGLREQWVASVADVAGRIRRAS